MINEEVRIFVYDPKVSRNKILVDLDYFGIRSVEENSDALSIFDNAYEDCKGARAVAILPEWDEFTTYD